MDKLSGLAKNGWKPAGDKPIRRDTWKQDLKGLATGKKADPYEQARNHQSAPLTSLKDPDSFGPPPKHSAYHGTQSQNQTPTTPHSSTAPVGGWGAPVPVPSRQKEQQQAAEEPPRPPEPYRANTTGLRTDNLPRPPTHRDIAGRVGSPASSASPSLPPRVPPRQAHTQPSSMPPPRGQGPPPILPPRQNEYPDAHTPAPPPPYAEYARPAPQAAGAINQAAVQRLGQAGINVPGFGIGGSSSNVTSPQSPARGPQIGDLQQRFARINTGSASTESPALASMTAAAAAAAHKKPPPPAPPKKAALSNVHAESSRPGTTGGQEAPTPPPLPLSSKPRPS